MRLEAGDEEISGRGDIGGRCLLLHGAGEDAAVWDHQLQGVEGTWAVDLPGHGKSGGDAREHISEYRDVVLQLLRRYARQPTVLGGHSMGGAIALSCALEAPELLAGLALISTGARLRVHPDLLSALETQDEMPQAFRRALVGPGSDADALLSSLAPPHPGAMHRDFLACDRFDVLDRLGEIRLRTLVLVGSDDSYTPPKYATRLAEALGGQLLVIAGAGHTIPLEAPTAVSGALSGFLMKG